MAGEPSVTSNPCDNGLQSSTWTDSHSVHYDNSEAVESSRTTNERCDVGIVINNVKRLEILSEPVVQTLKTISYVISWEFPTLTLGCWMISVTLCFTTTKVQLLWAILVILLVLAGLGFMVKKAKEKSKRNHRILKSPSAVNLLLTTPQDVQYQEDWQSKEVMSQYREFILDLQPAIVYTCHKLQTVYKILFWSNIYLSLLFYLGTMLAVLNLYLFPTFWTAAAAVNIVFFANGQFINIFKSLLKRISNRFQTRKLSEQCKKRDMNSKVEMPRLQVNEIMTIDSNTDKLVSDMTSTGAASDPEGDGSDVEQAKETESIKMSGKTSMVDKFRELRQRHKKLNSGSCTSCSVTFTTLLKRRRYCRNCGNHFCSKCCNRKVPRSTLGATAPAAHTEKELVCNSCYQVLVGEEASALRDDSLGDVVADYWDSFVTYLDSFPPLLSKPDDVVTTATDTKTQVDENTNILDKYLNV